MIDEKKLINWIDDRIKESKEFLKINGTTYLKVLENEDTQDYGEMSENYNFEVGIISGLLELKEEFLK